MKNPDILENKKLNNAEKLFLIFLNEKIKKLKREQLLTVDVKGWSLKFGVKQNTVEGWIRSLKSQGFFATETFSYTVIKLNIDKKINSVIFVK